MLEQSFVNFWYYEKILFNKFKFLQPIIKFPFLLLLIASLSIKKRKISSQIISNYQNQRGTSIFYDVNDWLGGFPYESINEK